MSLPALVKRQVDQALTEHGGGSVVGTSPVSGGCINNGARIETEHGLHFFVKWNGSAPVGMFEAEIDGLEALARTGTVRVPEAIACGGGDHEPSWLLLEYLPSGRPAPDYSERLGTELALLHTSERERTFGWERDNWIGSLDQNNTSASDWGDFWSERRIVPQLRQARHRGFLTDEVLDHLIDVIPLAVADVGPPGLLHGDLWSGNAFADADGSPVVIDPAVYRGHGEVDLAMTELFGGFDRRFYSAYDEVIAISPAYEAYRRDLYQLYYLIVHVNLFGAAYEAGSLAAASRVVAELS